MENRFKNRIARIFRGSLGSCRARYVSDVIEQGVFVPQESYHLLINTTDLDHDYDLHQHPNTPLHFPSLCRPKRPDHSSSTQFINPVQKKTTRSRSRFKYPPLLPPDYGGHPVSKSSSLTSNEGQYIRELDYYGSFRENKNTKKKNKRKCSVNEKKKVSVSSSSSIDSTQYFTRKTDIRKYNWFTSEAEEEEEEETLFSSRSTTLSSDSSRTSKRHGTHRRKTNKNGVANAGHGGGGNATSHVLPLMEVNSKVRDSVAVVKSSNDPYGDFRTSMVEMIVEKQIFGAKELEQLLQCFLSLNSKHHHKVIVEVFTEIWETLFSNWS